MSTFICPVDRLLRSNRRLRWTVAFLTLVVAWLCWRRNG